MSENPSAPPDENEASAEDASEAGTLLFLDPALDEERARALAEGLGLEMASVEPARFDPAEVGAEVAALAIRWDLGVQTGLDVVESLRRGEATRELPILVLSEAPTRGRVRAAMRAGATSFSPYPYDPQELAARLRDEDPPAPEG